MSTTERTALLAAMAADPLDQAPCLIYADWLVEHGEPILAQLLCAAVTAPDTVRAIAAAQMDLPIDVLRRVHSICPALPAFPQPSPVVPYLTFASAVLAWSDKHREEVRRGAAAEAKEAEDRAIAAVAAADRAAANRAAANRFRRQIGRPVRAHLGMAGSTCPIKLVDGFGAPVVTGATYHWTTRGGSPVRYPNAYAKKGWSNLVYHRSTIQITVGRGWLIERGIS